MNTAKINLEQFRTQSRTTKSRVFTGRDRGKEVREKASLMNCLRIATSWR